MNKKSGDNRYVFIGGAPKCGTSSLFRYLSDHPDVCPSSRKETYFFSREFDNKNVSLIGDTLEDFKSYFSHCPNGSNIRLEATPYTLYSKYAPDKISSLLKDISFIFVLRDPIKRLVSDYNFHVQREHPSVRGSIQDFLKWQNNMKGDIPNLIDQGCYARFITKYIDTFGLSKIKFMFFEDLISNPFDEMKKICSFLGINDKYYLDYDYMAHNPTINVRFKVLNRFYKKIEPIIATTRIGLMSRPWLYHKFEQFIDTGKSLYNRVNNNKKEPYHEFPPNLLQKLRNYYQPFNKTLSEVIGQPLPWKIVE